MALHIFANRTHCVRLGMTKTARGHSTSLRQNTKAVCIGVAGRKILGFVTILRKPASTISATANGSGASTRALSHAAHRSCDARAGFRRALLQPLQKTII